MPLDTEEVKKIIKDQYDIELTSLTKIKNVYKIECENKVYCLKIIKYQFAHFIFILSAMSHLQKREFNFVPEFIRTKENKLYINFGDSFAYVTEWVQGRQCNYDNPIDLKLATKKLAELHIKSEGFFVEPDMKPRIGWFKWFENFNTRKNEMLDFKKRIYSKDKLSEFDSLYISMLEENLEKAERALYFLSKSDYIAKMEEEIEYRGFCHHDYAHHNVLIDYKERINIIDFDYCMLDSHLHDLASLLIRVMKNGKWDRNKALYILDNYNEINKVYDSDIPIMASFMEFPQDYWQLGIQYYWENQPWEEEVFLKKLIRIKEDQEFKEEFLEEFRKLRYSGG